MVEWLWQIRIYLEVLDNEIKEHTEEMLEGVEEIIDESELEYSDLNEVSEDELDDFDTDSDDEFFTNILDEEDLPDDKLFKDLDSIDD